MNNNLQENPSFKVAASIVAVVLFLLGYAVGTRQHSTNSFPIKNAATPEALSSVDFNTFWKVWQLLDQKFPGSQEVTAEERVYGAIKGLTSAFGDPYTTFFTPEETKAFTDEISGTFSGVGMEIGLKENIITVIAPLKNTPAYRAGILSGDRILQIEDSPTAGMSVEQAVSLIRGEKGTPVRLIIGRENEELQPYTLTRDIIAIPTIDTEVIEDVFVIKLYNFSSQSPNLFREALRSFVTSGKKKLILDLRNNPGGYLEASIDMASWFLPVGKTVVIEDFGQGVTERVYRSKGYNIFSKDLEMVVLVNKGSASASEILAGALKEHGIATLVGQTTFGKGSVQELVPINNTTSLKVTIAKWLTPNRVSISEGGLTPDVEVSMTQDDILNDRDPQMEKALELLR